MEQLAIRVRNRRDNSILSLCQIEIPPFLIISGEVGTKETLLLRLIGRLRLLPAMARLLLSKYGTSAPEILRALVHTAGREVRHSASVDWLYSVTEDGVSWSIGYDEKGRIFWDKGAEEKVGQWVRETNLYRVAYLCSERVGKKGGFYPPSQALTYLLPPMDCRPGWADNFVPASTQAIWVRNLARAEFGGEVCRFRDRWVWRTDDNVYLPLRLVSPEVRFVWPIFILAESACEWKAQGVVSSDFALHIEYPEAMASPRTQSVIAHVLAYLANNGIRVAVTTHSLLFVYTINNLLVASEINSTEEGLPPPETRLRPGTVRGMFWHQSGEIKDITEPETEWISEEELAREGERLMVQANRMDVLLFYGD